MRVPGEIDLDLDTVALFAEPLERALSAGQIPLVVDMREVTFMDSTGIAALVRIHRRLGQLKESLVSGRQINRSQGLGPHRPRELVVTSAVKPNRRKTQVTAQRVLVQTFTLQPPDPAAVLLDALGVNASEVRSRLDTDTPHS